MLPTGSAHIGFSPPYIRRIVFLAGLAVVGVGFVHAFVHRWVCDDIFITFRYIDQWFAGNGLVYNVGERVEGYTHPLWLLLLAGFSAAGADLPAMSVWVGLLCHVVLLAALSRLSWKISGKSILGLPAAAAAIAVHHDASVWATSGLETSLFTLLVTLSVTVFVVWDGEVAKGRFIVGLLAVLAMLTRPDGILLLLFLASAGSILDWSRDVEGSERRRRLTAFAAPIAILIPYFLWKLWYYGDILPNTYYAKSGGGSYFSQGWAYVDSYLSAYPSTYGALVGVFVAVWAIARASKNRRRGVETRARVGGILDYARLFVRSCFDDRRAALVSTGLSFVVLYAGVFVVRVGGDFMFARFLIPVIPLVYVVIEHTLRFSFQTRRVTLLASLISIPIFVGTIDAWSRANAFFRTENGDVALRGTPNGIVDEHYFWTRPSTPDGRNAIVMLTDIGKRLGEYFRGLDVRIVIRGQASLAYYSGAALVIENWGLTDSFIAAQPMTNRGRVGHEKSAPYEYLLARRVHFFFYKTYTPPDSSSYRIVRFNLPHGWSLADMHYYDRGLMRKLGKRFPDDIQFTDFESYLNEYLGSIQSRSRKDVERDFADFRTFYFFHNTDPERERKFLEAMLRLR